MWRWVDPGGKNYGTGFGLVLLLAGASFAFGAFTLVLSPLALFSSDPNVTGMAESGRQFLLLGWFILGLGIARVLWVAAGSVNVRMPALRFAFATLPVAAAAVLMTIAWQHRMANFSNTLAQVRAAQVAAAPHARSSSPDGLLAPYVTQADALQGAVNQYVGLPAPKTAARPAEPAQPAPEELAAAGAVIQKGFDDRPFTYELDIRNEEPLDRSDPMVRAIVETGLATDTPDGPVATAKGHSLDRINGTKLLQFPLGTEHVDRVDSFERITGFANTDCLLVHFHKTVVPSELGAAALRNGYVPPAYVHGDFGRVRDSHDATATIASIGGTSWEIASYDTTGVAASQLCYQ